MPASSAQGRSIASCEGSLRSISTSMSVTSTRRVFAATAFNCLKKPSSGRVRDFVAGAKRACTRNVSSGLTTKSPGVM